MIWPVTRRIFALLPLSFLPATAQQRPADPVALVRSFYVPDYRETEQMPLSPRLAALLKAAQANSRKLESPVAGLDFSWTVAGQDVEDGMLKSLRYGEPVRQGAKTIVKVTFRNFGAAELQYDLIEAGGRWLVDDIHSLRKPRWTLSKMLEIGAKEKG